MNKDLKIELTDDFPIKPDSDSNQPHKGITAHLNDKVPFSGEWDPLGDAVKILADTSILSPTEQALKIIAEAAEKRAQSAEAQVAELKAHNQTFKASLAAMQEQLDTQKQNAEDKAKEDKKNFKLTIFWNVFNSIVAIVPIIIDIVTRMSS